MSTLDEKVITTDVRYEGDLVDLHILTIELPDGTRTQREVVQHPGAVAIVPLMQTGDQVWDVLLDSIIKINRCGTALRKYNHFIVNMF